MKKMSQTLLSLIFVLFLSSIALSDPTSAITSLVGRNAELYLSPIGTMLGTNMNSGYFRQAKPHKILGFDLTVDLTYSIAPPGETTYDFVIPDDEIDFNFPFKFHSLEIYVLFLLYGSTLYFISLFFLPFFE